MPDRGDKKSLRQQWKALSLWGRTLLILVNTQSVLLIVFSVASMVISTQTGLTDPNHDKLLRKDVAYGLVVIVSTFFFAYFAFDGVLNENKFEMTAFALVSILLTLRIIFAFAVLDPNVTEVPAIANRWMTLAVMVVVCVLQVFLVWLFVKTWKHFGWKLYRTVGANKSLITYFMKYQIFLSMLKIDVQFGLSLVLLAGFFLFDPASSTALWLNVVYVVISIVWAVLGWQMVIREIKVGMVFFFLFAVAEPAYIIYKVVGFYKPVPEVDCTYVPCILFTFTGCVAIGLRVALCVFAGICMRNFGLGMKKVFGTDKAAKAVAAGHTSLPPTSPTSPSSATLAPQRFSAAV